MITYHSNLHESEIALEGYNEFDYTINNNGTIDELIEQVKQILIKENLI
jgi:guanylate kinase